MRHDYVSTCYACGAVAPNGEEWDDLCLGYIHSECGFEVDPIDVPLCDRCFDNPESIRAVRADMLDEEPGPDEALAQARVVV